MTLSATRGDSKRSVRLTRIIGSGTVSCGPTGTRRRMHCCRNQHSASSNCRTSQETQSHQPRSHQRKVMTGELTAITWRGVISGHLLDLGSSSPSAASVDTEIDCESRACTHELKGHMGGFNGPHDNHNSIASVKRQSKNALVEQGARACQFGSEPGVRTCASYRSSVRVLGALRPGDEVCSL